MAASALAESAPPYRTRRTPVTAGSPGEPAITAAWLLGRIPGGALPWPLLRPGRAGTGPGPDIREATVLLPSGVPASGDVEVHRVASDFARHGHGDDPRYGRLLLHLVWHDDRPASERGGPIRLAGGGLAPTVALAPVFGATARLEAAVAQGPGGAVEPCASGCAPPSPAGGGAGAVLRAEGRRRLAERVWHAHHLAAEVGWEAAWRTLLDRALAASAGRRAERSAARVALADAVTAALATPHGHDITRALAERVRAASGRPAALLAAVRDTGLGSQRAREVGWNALLPLAIALAASHDEVPLARAAHALVEAWPAPPPYGRTRALARTVGVTPPDALTAQGLLRMQELWCTRGGCGRCPLSPSG